MAATDGFKRVEPFFGDYDLRTGCAGIPTQVTTISTGVEQQAFTQAQKAAEGKAIFFDAVDAHRRAVSFAQGGGIVRAAGAAQSRRQVGQHGLAAVIAARQVAGLYQDDDAIYAFGHLQVFQSENLWQCRLVERATKGVARQALIAEAGRQGMLQAQPCSTTRTIADDESIRQIATGEGNRRQYPVFDIQGIRAGSRISDGINRPSLAQPFPTGIFIDGKQCASHAKSRAPITKQTAESIEEEPLDGIACAQGRESRQRAVIQPDTQDTAAIDIVAIKIIGKGVEGNIDDVGHAAQGDRRRIETGILQIDARQALGNTIKRADGSQIAAVGGNVAGQIALGGIER